MGDALILRHTLPGAAILPASLQSSPQDARNPRGPPSQVYGARFPVGPPPWVACVPGTLEGGARELLHPALDARAPHLYSYWIFNIFLLNL